MPRGNNPPQNPNEQYSQDPYGDSVPAQNDEEEVRNIVGQIDPQRILDNLNHALKGEYYVKAEKRWKKVGDELINDSGRGWIISFFTSIMNNASTMGTINETQFSHLMEGVVNVVTREFRCNLEKFGFVPPGKRYNEKVYENKGTPDTSRMGTISEMIYQRSFIIYSRSLKGSESKRVFGSLNMNDSMGFNQGGKKSWKEKLFGA